MSGGSGATESVLVERRGAVAILTLNRPEVRNAIDDGLRERLSTRFAEVTADDGVEVVVLTGAGRAFCAGGDVAAMRNRLAAPAGSVAIEGWRRQRRTADFIARVRDSDRITIAAVNGPAVGLGLDLALACDFIVAAPEAAFASAFVRRGLVPDGGGMYFLPRRIGLQATKDMIYSGRSVDAAEALRLGLADRLAAPGSLLDDVLAYAERFLGASRPAISLMKSIVQRSFESAPEHIAALGGEAQSIAYTTDEHRASVEEFLRR